MRKGSPTTACTPTRRYQLSRNRWAASNLRINGDDMLYDSEGE